MLLRRGLLGLALVLLAIGGTSYLHRLRDLVPVVVTTQPVPAHTPLTADKLTVRQVNRDALATVAADAIQQIQDAVGLVARQDLPAGEVVRREPWLVGNLPAGADTAAARYQIPDGMRLAGLKVDAAGSVANQIAPGDRVDVILTNRSASLSEVSARTIIQAAEVFSVGDKAKGSTGLPGSDASGTEITLLLTPEQAQLLALAKRSGGSVDLSITPPNPTPVQLSPATLPVPPSAESKPRS